MVPLRNALIVKEHATLLYPEGTDCADVLLAGEEGGAKASTVFSGMGLAAIFKFKMCIRDRCQRCRWPSGSW